jgi:alcohol dehydrogenase class IV
MSVVNLLQPPRICFGDGCSTACGEYLAGRGLKTALLVTSRTVLRTLDGLLNSCRANGVRTMDAPTIETEPTIPMFEQVLAVARSEPVDCVVGAGGGSVLDVAKLVAALSRGSQQVTEVMGINLLRSRDLPLVCLPTTAGTGAEVSPNAILLDEADQLKKGVVSPHLVPDAAFVDPRLTLSVPPAVTAATGLDALTHCIEAFANRFSHPLVDGYALRGMRLIAAHLLRAVRDGGDLEAREALAMGSLLGGLCLGPVNTAAVHALAYPLGGRFHVAHGVSNAVLLPHVIRFNLDHAPDRYAEVALAVGASAGPTTRAMAAHLVDRLQQLSRACGVPQRLSELGVPREAIPSMARSAMQVTRLLKNNLRPVTEEDAIRIYEEAY